MTILYVSYKNTIADIAIQKNNSSNLSSILSFLLSIIIIVSFLLNILIFASIYSSPTLRQKLLYLLLSNVVFINLIDIMIVIFLSLLHISNSGQWIFGEFMCKINVFFQQFVLLISILSLLLMCAERAIGKNSLLKNVISKNNIYFCIFGIYIISIICCIPLFLKDFVTLPDRYHFQCLLNGQAPIGYTYFMIFLYIIITLTIGIGLILIRIQKHVHRSLPNSQEEYGRFINETRELHENTNLTKLTVYLLITYAILQLPYIILIFYNRFKEASLYESSTSFISIYSDFETLITFLRFMFPFISAIIISFRCFDIWVKIVNLICCRRTGPITINQWNNNMNATNNINQQTFFSGNCDNNVITIVATGNGMELRIPKEIVQNPLIYDKPPPSYIEMNNEKDNTNVNGTNSNNENINIIEGDPNIPSQSNKPINEIVTNDINTQPHKLTSKNTKPKIKRKKKEYDQKIKNSKVSKKIVVKGQFIKKKQPKINPINK